MAQVNGVLTNHGYVTPIIMRIEPGWSAAQVESVWRMNQQVYTGRIEIPSMGYKSEQDKNGVKKMYNADGIGDEHQSLWCEVAKHGFSAKDPDKVLLQARGESRLSCGPCAVKLFPGAVEEDTRAVES